MTIEKYDTVYAVCTMTTKNGTYVELEPDGTVGWIKNRWLKKGTRVLCTVDHINLSDFPILLLDAVIYDAMAA